MKLFKIANKIRMLKSK